MTRERPSRVWTAAVLLTAAVMGLPMLTVRWNETPPELRPPMMHASLSVAPPAAEKTGGLWSPDLFALPTLYGFSGAAAADAPPPPRFRLAAEEPRFRARGDLAQAFDGPATALPAPALSPPARAPARVSLQPAGRVWIELRDAADRPWPAPPSLVLPPEACGTAAWSLELDVVTDETGTVLHVLREEPWPAGVDAGALERALHQWRLTPGRGAATACRVRLVFEGRPAGDAARKAERT